MRLVRVDGLAVIIMVGLFGTLACKPQSSASPRKPAVNPSEEEEEQDPNPPANTNTTASQPAPATATTPANTGVPPISITPGSGSGSAQPGGFIGNLISQFGGGGFGGLSGGLGGLTSSLGGLLNGGGLGGFDFGSLLNGLGSGFGGLANGFGGQANASTANTGNPGSSSSAQIALVSNTGDLRVDCLNAINQYRASVGRPALTLKNDESTNSCIDKQSADDGAAGAAHRNFGKCGESAQDECPGWSGDPSTAQTGCLKMMWAEGPGGGHYENMANGAYKQVSCGYAQVGGKLWMIQNFYR